MDNEKDLLKQDLGNQENPEEIKKFIEDAEILGHEDIAELGRKKLQEISEKADSIGQTSESQISQVNNLGGSSEELASRTGEVDKKIEEVIENTKDAINAVENQNNEKKGSVEDVEKLKEDKERVEIIIEKLEKELNALDSDISSLNKQKPEIKGDFVNREYEHFVEGLGDTFDKKISTLNSIKQDMLNELNGKSLDEVNKINLSKSANSMSKLIENLKNNKQGNEIYDNQQFIRLSRSAFQVISGMYHNSSFISKYNGYYNKFLEAESELNQYVNKVNNDPKNIEIDKQIYELGQVYQKKSKDKQLTQIERNRLEKEIQELESK